MTIFVFEVVADGALCLRFLMVSSSLRFVFLVKTCVPCAPGTVLPLPSGKGPAKAIDTFALQRDLGKLDHKALWCREGFALEIIAILTGKPWSTIMFIIYE